jgi:hypothetical protein
MYTLRKQPTIQYTYIIRKYIILFYELYKQVDKRANGVFRNEYKIILYLPTMHYVVFILLCQ